jgi:hypothetical protein
LNVGGASTSNRYVEHMTWWTDDVGRYVAGCFAIAAYLALRGTNLQAALAKQSWLSDPNPDIKAAALLWAPGPRWIRGRAHVAKWKALESAIQRDPAEWARCVRLMREFYSWNDLETSVAIAFIGSLLACVAAFWPSL